MFTPRHGRDFELVLYVSKLSKTHVIATGRFFFSMCLFIRSFYVLYLSMFLMSCSFIFSNNKAVLQRCIRVYQRARLSDSPVSQFHLLYTFDFEPGLGRRRPIFVFILCLITFCKLSWLLLLLWRVIFFVSFRKIDNLRSHGAKLFVSRIEFQSHVKKKEKQLKI